MKTTLRSTNTITSFVEASDRLAGLKVEAKQLEMQLKQLTTDVLSQIGERREVRVNGQVRILTPRVVESISRACDDATIVQLCKSVNLPYQERSAEYVHASTFAKYVRNGIIPEDMIERTIETQVTVV